MNNDFNNFDKDKLEVLIDEKMNDKISYCNKKIDELKISNEISDKKLQDNVNTSNEIINKNYKVILIYLMIIQKN